jgi:flavin reductase (DIM6/NTAB) family NADH-FMN oxidoreductase RutF
MIIDPKTQNFSENHKLMIGSILPRPIAFVSTCSLNGIFNLAPFSYFNGVCSKPPTIVFAPARRGYDGKTKDTLDNIRETGEFAVNIVSEDIAEKMVDCSTDFEPEISEFDIAKLTPLTCQKIKAPMVKESKVRFECILNKIVSIGNPEPGGGFIVIGTIVLFHIDDDIYNDGKINIEKLQPIGRLSGNKYIRTSDSFEIIRKVKPD